MAKIGVAGRVVLITGGARGMGKLWAQHFAADGARIVLWDLDEATLEETAAELEEQGIDVFTQVVDVTDTARVYEAADEVAEEFGVVDILLNNAGIVAAGNFLEMPDAGLAATIDVDLKAVMWTMKAFMPGMLDKGWGHIINVSSASGFIGVPFMPAYAASKWGVIGLTESIRLELGLQRRGEIGFTIFCPGYVDTGMFKGVKAPLFVPILTPEEAVSRGYSAFREGTYLIKEPFMVKTTPILKALLPVAWFDAVSSLLGVTGSMKNWTGRD